MSSDLAWISVSYGLEISRCRLAFCVKEMTIQSAPFFFLIQPIICSYDFDVASSLRRFSSITDRNDNGNTANLNFDRSNEEK